MKYRGLLLDPFQETAIRHLRAGRSVLVSAPTGNGKTIIADWIVEEALRTNKQVIYTAPIKALSNQKFRDYVRLYGEDRVGLVTGDLVIRPDAPCRVMTTEILRNMLLAGQELPNLLAVVIDEIHFLDDPERGTVWEEVLIYLDKSVQVVGLSATLSNLTDFAAWLSEVRESKVEVVRAFERIVPLSFHYASKKTGICTPADYHQKWKRYQQTNPAGGWEDDRQSGGRRGRGGRGRGRSGGGQRNNDRDNRHKRLTRHYDLFYDLLEADLLPYLYFVFSRKNTEQFARSLAQRMEETLLDDRELRLLDEHLRKAASDVGPALDRELREMYRKGVGFHHAGLHVGLKALVEGLYEEKLIKVLYCTSTFALGINMPARSVVFDGIMKYDGTRVAPLTTRGFMQKAGRAGRRGMDDHGHVIVRMELDEYSQLKPQLEHYQEGRYEPVRSTFNLSWNSVVNLLANHDEDQIRELVDKSFLSWWLKRESERQLGRATQLDDAALEGGKKAHQHAKEAHRLRRRAHRSESRCWNEFQAKVRYLTDIGYLAEDGSFNAGAKVLRHIQIAEIFVTELVLSGLLEDLAPNDLFGVLCAMTNDLGRNVIRNFTPRKADKALVREIHRVRFGKVVTATEELANAEVVWCPDLLVVGRAWAEGRSLQEILLLVPSPTDISGDLITGFRRAKDLAGQLVSVYAEDPDRTDEIRALIRSVSRDEVEVID